MRRYGGRTVSDMHLGDLAADFEHYMSEFSARRDCARKATVKNPFDDRDTPDLFTILSEPWSEDEVEEFLELVQVPEKPSA